MNLQVLLPMACDGYGPSFACARLLQGIMRDGAITPTLFANRARISLGSLPHRLALPRGLGALPYRYVATMASQRSDAAFRRAVEPGDVLYLWPSVSVETHEWAHARGAVIVLEGINTRMASAKNILDAAYDDFGAPPAHGITEARIAAEERKLAVASYVFAPSPAVEAALAGSPAEGRAIPTSYGVELGHAAQPSVKSSARDGGSVPEVLFCAYGCVRKGLHHLLAAWERLRPPAQLTIVGALEPVVAERFAATLSDDSVRFEGFQRDLVPYFARADLFVLPSLEEGDPLVTYMAALNGAAVIATPMGAGRLGAENDCMRVTPPGDSDAIAEALEALICDGDMRADLSLRARRAVTRYGWDEVAARRARALTAAIDGTTRKETTA